MYRRVFLPGLVLLLGAAMAGLVLSCGGNSNNCGSFVNGQFVSGPCSQTVPPLGAQLIALHVCAGPPAGPTAKPTSTSKPSPAPTFTPCPTPAATTAMIPNPLNLNAAGKFKFNNSTYFKNLTGQAGWFVSVGSGNLFYTSNGQFSTVNPGCSCVVASSGGLVGGPMAVTILPSSGPAPTCGPCPTVAPTPAAAARLASAGESGSTPRTGVVMWRFNARAAFEGRMAVAPSGAAVYFITADGLIHAINSGGREIFTRFTGGGSPVVASNGIIYASAPGGGLMALTPAGKLKWIAAAAKGAGPLAAGPDDTVYDAAGDELIATDVSGSMTWRIPMPGVRQALLTPDDEIIAVTDGGLTALSAHGTNQWTFAPPGGIAGEVATSGGVLFAASSQGMLYALDAASGNELWEREIGGSPRTGVAASADERLYIGAMAKLNAFNFAGGLAWSSIGIAPTPVTPAISANGTVFAAAHGGHLAAIAPDGTVRWVGGNFGSVGSMMISSSNALYVISKDGVCWSLREIIDSN